MMGGKILLAARKYEAPCNYITWFLTQLNLPFRFLALKERNFFGEKKKKKPKNREDYILRSIVIILEDSITRPFRRS